VNLWKKCEVRRREEEEEEVEKLLYANHKSRLRFKISL